MKESTAKILAAERMTQDMRRIIQMMAPTEAANPKFMQFVDFVIEEINIEDYNKLQAEVWEQNYTDEELSQIVFLYDKYPVLQKMRHITLNVTQQIQLKTEGLLNAAMERAAKRILNQQ